MFELTIAFRYLIPRKKKLSRSLISLLSLLVISLVVWLVIVFLSITAGLENKWLQNLVSLHAPARMTPSDSYYNSYDCLIDRYSSESDYKILSLEEKRKQNSIPYDESIDPELPLNFPTEKQIILPTFSQLKPLEGNLNFVSETYNYGYGQIEIPLHAYGQKGRSLKSTSIIHSFSQHNPYLESILAPPTPLEIKELLFKILKSEDKDLKHILQNISIQPNLLINNMCVLSPKKIDLSTPIKVSFIPSKHIRSIFITDDQIPGSEQAYLSELEGCYSLQKGQNAFDLDPSFSITLQNPDQINTFSKSKVTFKDKDAFIAVSMNFTSARSVLVDIPLSFLSYDVETVHRYFEKVPKTEPLWTYYVKSSDKKLAYIPSTSNLGQGVLLASSLKDQGASIGDQGVLSYRALAGGAQSEVKCPFFIAGFYDSGIGGLGSKLIYAPKSFVQSMVSNQGLHENEGIFLWADDIKDIDNLKIQINNALSASNLTPYWNVETYKTYDFSKDFVQQLQSDRLLLTLIAGIILLVAGSNIISMLLLLIHDKKSEIGILQALGAKPYSIALTFGFCGIFIGLISATAGTIAAYFTLINMDILASFLSKLQGHDVFNTAFYGKSLPKAISWNIVLQIWIMTTMISFIAGLIPAIKACTLTPTQTLRNDA